MNVTGIHLLNESRDGRAWVVVRVEIDGVWREAMREPIDGVFSHIIEESGLRFLASHNCPVCGGEAQMRCRCMLADSVCSLGHHWHICPVHHLVVVGESNHAAPMDQCSCKQEAAK